MPEPVRPVIPEQPTRQQLDELDELMERMLALPVNEPDSSSLTGPKSVATFAHKTREHQEREFPATSIRSDEAPGAHEAPVVHSGATIANARIEAERTPRLERIPDIPLTEAAVAGIPSAWPMPMPLTGQTRPEFGFAIQEARVSSWLRCILWCNAAYDSVTRILGPLGRWLREPGGRAVIGVLGILLLIGALGWVVLGSWNW